MSYKTSLKIIHTTAVRETTSSYRPNMVLERKPLDINVKENFLPRCTRTTLSQLRSGWCRHLRSYQDETTLDIGPDCGNTHHDVPHLFNCSEKPTNLTVENLWIKPEDVAIYLGLTIDKEDEDDD